LVKIFNIITLEDIKNEYESCMMCYLHNNRNLVVFGVGNPRAEVLFIGESPGKKENPKGVPFVGSDGNLLNYYF
jgi:uracil-DNA glycosylase